MLPLKSFYFIRHGETEWNQQGIIMGHQDIPLNTIGIQQAHHARKILEQENFSTIYTSPLQRAYQTAQILSDGLKKEVISENLLKERHWGQLEGLSRTCIKDKGITVDNLPSDAEASINFEVRILRVLCQILNLSDIPPLIVAHSGVFITLVKMLGYLSLRTANCIPFLFKPPEQETHPWIVCNLSGQEGL